MSKLKFFPEMPLIEAAKIAAKGGYELRVHWNGRECEVEAVSILDKDYVPAFLRPQIGPVDKDRVVKLRQVGA